MRLGIYDGIEVSQREKSYRNNPNLKRGYISDPHRSNKDENMKTENKYFFFSFLLRFTKELTVPVKMGLGDICGEKKEEANEVIHLSGTYHVRHPTNCQGS